MPFRSTPVDDEQAVASPPARRARTPRWFDLRLVLGVGLVLLAVIAGARVISAADRTVSVWVMSTDLSAGSTITASDVSRADVGLDEHAQAYLGSDADPVGKVLTRDVSAGDLLPAAAVVESDGLVAMALSVPAASVPVTLGRGDQVSVYATATGPAGSDEPAESVIVVESVTVAEISDRSQGALSTGGGALQLVIRVGDCEVAGILEATAGRELAVVETDGPPRTAESVC